MVLELLIVQLVDKGGLLRVTPHFFPPAGKYFSFYMFDMAGDSGCLMRIRLRGHGSEIFIIIPDFKFRRVYSADSRIAVFVVNFARCLNFYPV
jgi:hypothetical protein